MRRAIIATLASAGLAFWLGRHYGFGLGYGTAALELAESDQDVADTAFRAGFNSAKLAADDLGAEPWIVEQRKAAPNQ